MPDAQTDANSITSSTIAVVAKTASVVSPCSQYFLSVTMIAKTEVCTLSQGGVHVSIPVHLKDNVESPCLENNIKSGLFQIKMIHKNLVH